MPELYNHNFLTSNFKSAKANKRPENVASANEILKIAKECKLIERQRNFDVVALVCGLLDFNDRKHLFTSKYTINNLRLNYYAKYATKSISDKAFHKKFRKPESIPFLKKTARQNCSIHRQR